MHMFSVKLIVKFTYFKQEDNTVLIHRAALYGELDTLKDLIEEKRVDPCMTNNVSIN